MLYEKVCNKVVLLMMCFILLAMDGCVGESSTYVFTPTPTLTPTFTPVPAPANTPTNSPATMPTATLVPTDTPLPPPPTATPTPPQPTLEAPGFVLLDQRGYTSSVGNAIVVGVLKYTGSEVTAPPPINITLEDAEHNMLATGDAFTVPRLVKPGMLVPFGTFFVKPPYNWKRFDIRVFPTQRDNYTVAKYSTDFAFDRTNMRPSNIPVAGSASVVGEVKNTGKQEVSLVEVIATIWDSEDRLLDVNSVTARRPTMSPGDTSPFEVYLENGVGAARYDLVAVGIKK